MNLFIELHQDLLRKLLNAGVDFIVIGDYSVIYHGYNRTTGDIDIWLKPDNANKAKLLPVLRDFGFEESDLIDVATLNFTDHIVFSIGDYPEKIDFITRINLVEYDEADRQKIFAEVDGLTVPFLHLNHLVLSKMNTGRPKDQADVDMLQKIERAKDKK